MCVYSTVMEVWVQPAGLTPLLVGPQAPIQVFRLGSKQLSNATFSVHSSWGSTGLDSGEPLVTNVCTVVSSAVLQQPSLSVLLL